MILVNNIVFMKERFPAIWEVYRAEEDKQNPALVIKEASKTDNYPTLCVNQGEDNYYLHSRYNPKREAQAIVDNYDGSNYEHVIFYGIGLGYHMEQFLNKYPHLTFSIYEPIPEVFNNFISHFDLNTLPKRHLREVVVEISDENAKAFLQRTITQAQGKILFIDLPSYRNAFPKQHGSFLHWFKEIVTGRSSSVATDYAFEKRWIINSLLNFKEVLNTPNIIAEKAGAFKDKPAILVAAGPSLDYEIENLRHIKENGLAYIFSVGSAVDALIEAGFYPHAQCTYDPSIANQNKTFARITKEKISDIPLIFGSSVAHEVLVNYPGKHKLHMITSQDTISTYLLKIDDDKQLDAILDVPSVAVVTLQLLYKLGFNPIILVGQNLAYVNNRFYATGVTGGKEIKLDENNSSNLIKIQDVSGQEIYTNNSLNQMRISMELFIDLMPNTKIINTTQGGAHIKGTEFRYLRELIEDKALDDKVVERNWYIISPTNYERDYIYKQFKKLNKDYELLEIQLKNLKEILVKINSLREKRNIKQLGKIWGELDKDFSRVQNNRFFDKVIRPMNRVSYELLVNQIPNLRFENDLIKKADLVVEVYSRLARAGLADCKILKEEIVNLKKEIDNIFN